MMKAGLALTLLLTFGTADADPATRVSSDVSVPVDVSVRAAAGRPVDQAYIAFVSPDRPASRPAIETILPRGTATVRVPPGAYHVFAAGPGLQEASRSVTVQAGSNIVFDLKPAPAVGGVVQDDEGQPIAGASVRHMRSVGPVQIAQVSALARRHFAADWQTRTDANGIWTLPGHDDGSIPVLIEAPGYAPEHRYHRPSETHTTTLRTGSALGVSFDKSEPQRYVTLLRHTPPGGAAVNVWESVAWARPIESTTILWESLPAGKYSVVVRYVEARRFSHPTTVGVVEIAAGARGELKASLPAQAPVDDEAWALFVPGMSRTDLAGLRAVVLTEGDVAEEVEHSLETVFGGTVVYLRNTAPPASTVLMTPTAIYGPRTVATPSEDRPVATVRSPRADATVLIEAAGSEVSLPGWAMAQFSGCEFPQRLVFAVPVSKSGKIELPFPTACGAVALRLPPFAPIVFHTSLAPGTRKTFGPYALKRAASADIHVVRERSGTAAAGALVRVLPSPRDPRAEIVIAEGIADAGGRLHLAGLPADSDLIVEARARESDLSGAVTLRLAAGKVATIDPLPIPEPATLVVTPRLASELLEKFPEAKLYSMIVEPIDDRSAARRVVVRMTDHTQVVFKDLRPGKWSVIALVEAAGTMQPIPLDTITLHSGEARRLQAVVAPAIVEGRVVSPGGGGVAAQVGFGEPPPTAARRFARADTRGRFTILLPQRGVYNVIVSPLADEGRTRIDLGEVDVTDSVRTTELRIPSASITVRVEERGEAVQGAEITATLQRQSAFRPIVTVEREATSGPGGEATLHGLMSGRWLIQAVSRRNGYRSEASVSINERDSGTVALDLQPAAVLRGMVRDARDAAVPGARVDCLFVGAGAVPQTAGTDSDDAGRFSIDLSLPAPALMHCAVTTSSGHAVPYVLTPSTAELRLPAATGSLTISDWDFLSYRDAVWLVGRDGRMLNVSWFAAKAGAPRGALTIPHIPTGSWKVVRIKTLDDWDRMARAGGNALSPVTEFRVQEGEVKTVDLDPRSTEF